MRVVRATTTVIDLAISRLRSDTGDAIRRSPSRRCTTRARPQREKILGAAFRDAMGIFSCCCPSADAFPEYTDAAAYLNAQTDAILSDGLCPGLTAATQATLVYGTRMFRTPPAHGISPAAECTVTTLEGRKLIVRLDVDGLHVMPLAGELWSSDSNECFEQVADVLAYHSPGYVAAFREVNGAAPQVHRRKSTPRKRAFGRRRATLGTVDAASQQWARIISSRPTAAMRLHDTPNLGPTTEDGLHAVDTISSTADRSHPSTPTRRHARAQTGISDLVPPSPHEMRGDMGRYGEMHSRDPALAPVHIERLGTGGQHGPRGPTRLVLNACGTVATSAATSACSTAYHATTTAAATTYAATSYAASGVAGVAVAAIPSRQRGASHEASQSMVEARGLLGRHCGHCESSLGNGGHGHVELPNGVATDDAASAAANGGGGGGGGGAGVASAAATPGKSRYRRLSGEVLGSSGFASRSTEAEDRASHLDRGSKSTADESYRSAEENELEPTTIDVDLSEYVQPACAAPESTTATSSTARSASASLIAAPPVSRTASASSSSKLPLSAQVRDLATSRHISPRFPISRQSSPYLAISRTLTNLAESPPLVPFHALR